MSASKVDRELFNKLLYRWNLARYKEEYSNSLPNFPQCESEWDSEWLQFQKDVDDELDQIFSQRESISIFGYENYEKLLEGTTSTFLKNLDYSDFLGWMHSKFWPIVECMDKDAELSLSGACEELGLTVPAQDIFEHWKNYDPPGSEPPRPKRMASSIMTSLAQFKSAKYETVWDRVRLWKYGSDEKPPIIVPIALGQPAGTEVKFRLCMNGDDNCRWLAPETVRGSYPGTDWDYIPEEREQEGYYRWEWIHDPNDDSEDRLFVLGNFQCEEDPSSSTFNELFAGYQLGYLECMKVGSGEWETTNLAVVLRKQRSHPKTSGHLYVIDEEKLAGKENLKMKAGILSGIIRTIFGGRVWINVDEENDYHVENAADDGWVKDNMGSIETYRAELGPHYVERWSPNPEPEYEWSKALCGWVIPKHHRTNGSRG